MPVDDSYTKSLLHFNGADASTTFTDESGKTWTAYGDAQIDTAQSVFGGASGLFDGTGDYISTPDTTDFDFGTGDFSIDFRIRIATNPGNGYWTIFQIGAYGIGVAFLINTGSSANIHANIMGTAFDFSGTIALNTWYHIALTRSGTDLRCFVDGTQLGSAQTSSNDIQVSSESWIGRSVDGYTNAWFDEFRVSKGVARWTANFTPPSAEYEPLFLAEISSQVNITASFSGSQSADFYPNIGVADSFQGDWLVEGALAEGVTAHADFIPIFGPVTEGEQVGLGASFTPLANYQPQVMPPIAVLGDEWIAVKVGNEIVRLRLPWNVTGQHLSVVFDHNSINLPWTLEDIGYKFISSVLSWNNYYPWNVVGDHLSLVYRNNNAGETLGLNDVGLRLEPYVEQ